MQFGFTPEQAALGDAVRRFLDTSDRQQNRLLVDSDLPYDTAMWRRAADELGLMSVPIPAEFDGAGGGMVELSIILEEFGRRLTRSPSSPVSALPPLHCSRAATARPAPNTFPA